MIENKLYCDIAAIVQQIVELTMKGYCFFRLTEPFMERKEKAWCAGAAYSVVMLALYILPPFMGSYMATGIGACVALLVMCRADRRNYGQKVFLAVTFYSLCWLAAAIAEILYDNLYSYAEKTDYMARHLNQWFALYVVMCVVYVVSELAVLSACIWCVLKVYVYKSADMAKRELCMLSAPLFTGAVGYRIMCYYRTFYILENGHNTDEYDVLALLYYAVSIISVVVTIGLYQSIRAKQEEKLQNGLLAAQIESIRQHIGQVEALHRDIRGIKHDMKNHILTLERLYTCDKPEEAKEYSTQLMAALDGAAGEIKSGNPITDVILQEWKNMAEKNGISFRLDFYYPTGMGINAFDISVILHNALQNAVENVEKCGTPYIFIRSYHRNNAYMIEVGNRFLGSLQWDRESGLPVTSKGKADGHGYGLSNIRRVAEKYSGDIAVDIKDGEFCLSIMLIME